MRWSMEWAVASSLLILLVLAVRTLLGQRLSPRLRYALWGVVLVRLLIPGQAELPAAVSQGLPLLASNLAPAAPRGWEVPTIPVFPTDVQPYDAAEEYQYLEPGVLSSTHTSMGYVRRSGDGETITFYFDLLSPAQVVQWLWVGGAVAAGGALLLCRCAFSLRLRRRRRPLEGAAAPVPVYVAEGLPSPCLFGLLRPAVYLTPEGAEEPVRPYVLVHELTHLAHGDHIWAALRCLCLALHWYNPLVWLAAFLSREDGELACDQGAVARLGEEARIPYGRTLVDMVARRSLGTAGLLSGSTAMTGGKRSIQQRVRQIVRQPETRRAALFAAAALMTLAAVFVFTDRPSLPPTARDQFLETLEAAQAIRYGPPLYSSQMYPYPIQDEDLLEEAKDLLSTAAPLDEGVELRRDTLMHASRITLTVGAHEEPYTLLHDEGRTYLVPGQVGWWEEDAPSPWLSEALQFSENIIPSLVALARRQTERSWETWKAVQPRPLTEEALQQANAAFLPVSVLPNGDTVPSEISCFFTSSYAHPSQINLEEFLAYCPLAEPVEEAQDPAEYRQVLEASFWAEEASNPDFFLPVPIHRYPREAVSALLQTYAGVTVEDLDWSGCLYLEEYDAFYNFTSDFGPGVFRCASGEQTGDTLRLWSEANGEGTRWELTLRRSGDNWHIQSHQLASSFNNN